MAAFPTTNINLSNVNQLLGYMTAPFNFTNLQGRILYNSQGYTYTTPTTGPISFDDFRGQLYATNCGMYNRIINNYASKSGAAAYTVYENPLGIQTFCVSDSYDYDNNSSSTISFRFQGDPSTYTQTRRLTVTFYHHPINKQDNENYTKSRFDKVTVNNKSVFYDDSQRYGGDGDFTNTYTTILTNNTNVAYGDIVTVEMYLDGYSGTRWDNTTTLSITNG